MSQSLLLQSVGNVNNDVELEAAVAALDAICAQIDFVRGLRECSNADAQLDVARHNLVSFTISVPCYTPDIPWDPNTLRPPGIAQLCIKS